MQSSKKCIATNVYIKWNPFLWQFCLTQKKRIGNHSNLVVGLLCIIVETFWSRWLRIYVITFHDIKCFFSTCVQVNTFMGSEYIAKKYIKSINFFYRTLISHNFFKLYHLLFFIYFFLKLWGTFKTGESLSTIISYTYIFT